tara:strand:- start:439 stop:822 length:384 start_codon:yes stop_codon:yes gene_type:complete
MAGTTTQTKSTQIKLRGSMTEDTIKRICYTKVEIDAMIAEAVEEARRIDEASMAKHNREATIISMILGFTCLALFLDGLLRILGVIPPFMHLDVNVIDAIKDQVETDILDDVIDKVRQVPIKKILNR